MQLSSVSLTDGRALSLSTDTGGIRVTPHTASLTHRLLSLSPLSPLSPVEKVLPRRLSHPLTRVLPPGASSTVRFKATPTTPHAMPQAVVSLVKEANLFFGISFLLLDGGEAAGADRAASCDLPGGKDGFASLCQKAANILDIDGEWVSKNNAYFDSSKYVQPRLALRASVSCSAGGDSRAWPPHRP
jgi:hypothetical protein